MPVTIKPRCLSQCRNSIFLTLTNFNQSHASRCQPPFYSGQQNSPCIKPVTATIQRQIQWNRLIAVVEEQAQSLLRTAFGTR